MKIFSVSDLSHFYEKIHLLPSLNVLEDEKCIHLVHLLIFLPNVTLINANLLIKKNNFMIF